MPINLLIVSILALYILQGLNCIIFIQYYIIEKKIGEVFVNY